MQRCIENPLEHLGWRILQILVNDSKLKTKLAKSTFLDVWLGSEYASGIFSLSWRKIFAIVLMTKSSNRLNIDQTKWFVLTKNAHTNISIWKYVNKQCKTQIQEHISLRILFFKAWVHTDKVWKNKSAVSFTYFSFKIKQT